MRRHVLAVEGLTGGLIVVSDDGVIVERDAAQLVITHVSCGVAEIRAGCIKATVIILRSGRALYAAATATAIAAAAGAAAARM